MRWWLGRRPRFAIRWRSADALDAGDAVPALDGIVLDFDHYGRLVGLRVTGAADSTLAPSLLEAAARSEPGRGDGS